LLFCSFIVIIGIKAARNIHKKAICHIILAPVLFFDTTPLGRTINRFSKNQDSLDTYLFVVLQMFISDLFSSVTTLILIAHTSPFIIIALVSLTIIYYYIKSLYRRSSCKLKRLESITRSLLYINVNETLQGLLTIRIYNIQNHFIKLNQFLINENNRPYFIT
ncbi:ABC transporter type 1, transmembrane domain-containing protein, partial [Neocallimastix sp. 'constans']